MSTLHCMLENGADLHVNERQKIQHYHARSTEEEELEELEEEERRRMCRTVYSFRNRFEKIR